MPKPPTTEPAADDLSEPAVRQACHWVTSQCRPGAEHAEGTEEALQSGREAVEILRPLGVDGQGLSVALLQPLLPVDEKEQARIAERFGAATLELLQRTAQMRQLSALSRRGADARAGRGARVDDENLRKMLIAMVDDLRVVLIELARHLVALRRARRAAAAQQAALGRITLEVYAPLANRLGIRQMKWQMEDHALHFLEPEEYRNLAAALDEKRAARERYIGEFTAVVGAALADSGIAGQVHGRPKHLFGIWKKMRHKGLAFEDLQDIRALRIVVDSVADCYAALAVVHTRWRCLPEEFTDYIATPKANGYRSIHTVIIGPRGQTVEVQIRTGEMHRHSELGVAAHWRYKENVRGDESIDNKIVRLRQLLQWKEEMRDAGAWADGGGDAPAAPGEDRVYVFTPKGMVIDLPGGSTPVDFAYAIHTQVGHRIRGALVNGKMAPLSQRLETGQQVHIQTARGGRPSRDWLRKELGYVRTRRARNRIALWFKRADYAQHLAEGRALLERELSRLGLEDLSYDKIARATHFNKADDLLAALGAGDFKLSRALAPFRRARRPVEPPPPRPPKPQAAPRGAHAGDFSVSGVGNLLTRMANCCSPVPGDPIVGFITVGRGVSIHRRDCANLQNLDAPRRERLIEVRWGKSGPASWPVELRIWAYHRSGLLHDITQLFQDEKVAVLKLNLEAGHENSATIQVALEISGLKKLNRILRRLERVPDVLQVRRAAS